MLTEIIKIMEIVKTTKVYGKRQTQIPIEICKHLNLKDGDKVVWVIDSDGNITVRKIEVIKEGRKTEREFTGRAVGII